MKKSFLSVSALFVLFVALLLPLLFSPDKKTHDAKGGSVFNPYDLLNSEKMHKEQYLENQNAVSRVTNKKASTKGQESYKSEVEQSNQNFGSLNLRIDNTSNNNDADSQNLEWMLDALSEVSRVSKSNSVIFDDPNLFIGYSNETQVFRTKNIANEKYQDEKLYLNILAAVLIKHQYENNTPESMEKFRSWFANKNPSGKEQVIKEATDYLKIAELLENAEVVPSIFKDIHYKMARAYKDAGNFMLLLAKNMSDKERLKVLESYTKAANDVTKAYIAVSDMIDILGISFDNDEPGKLFVFPGSKVPWNEN